MKLRKYELVIIIFTVAFAGATAGYLIARVPVAGTFEITTQLVPVTPTVAKTTEIADNTATPKPEATAAPSTSEPDTYTPPSGLVNINTAGAEELQTLTGIGPELAKRILEEREANGQYASVDELTRVNGIGTKTVDRLRDEATVS